MSANAGYTSNQGEVKQQERDTSAQNNGNSTQYGSSPASRSINNNNGLQNDGGFSSFDAASGNSYMSNSMGTGYSSGYGNSYGGGYGSSLGGGYGGYSSYGGGYGSSYGSAYGSGYGSSYGSGYGGYSSYGANNQYSNRMSKPLPQNNQEDVGPQQVPVSQDVWGLLNGMQAILQILYAGTGIVQFGKMFVKMSMKIMRLVCGKSLGVVFRLTGFNFLKNIITKMASGKDWTSEFSAPDLNLEGEWGNSRSSNTNKSLFGKIILVTRLCSILGAIFSWFLSNKASRNTTPRPIQNIPVPEIIAHEITTDQENVPIAFEDVNNIEDEVKLVENEEQYIEEQANNLVQAFENESEDMDGDLRRLDAFAEEAGIQAAQEEAKLENNKEVEIQIIQAIESEVEVISAGEDKKDQLIFAADAMNALEEVIKINEVVDVPVVDNLEETVVLIKEEKDNDEENVVTKSEDEKPVEKVETMNPAPVVEAASDKPSDKILSEDFWKNKLDTLEETKKVEEKKEEKPEKAFEMPSVLQTLRDKPAASNKPWLMKKKKPVVEEKTESQASEAHTTTSTVSEVKAATENISEVKINESATPGNSENLVTADLINSAAVDSTHITL